MFDVVVCIVAVVVLVYIYVHILTLWLDQMVFSSSFCLCVFFLRINISPSHPFGSGGENFYIWLSKCGSMIVPTGGGSPFKSGRFRCIFCEIFRICLELLRLVFYAHIFFWSRYYLHNSLGYDFVALCFFCRKIFLFRFVENEKMLLVVIENIMV